MSGALRGCWSRRRERWTSERGDWLAWLGIVLLLGALQGPAWIAWLRNAFDPQLLDDDARQQIYPFFRYLDARPFAHDVLGDYYLACLPAGYRLLMTGTALLGIDPATTSKALPVLALIVTAAALTAVARRVGGRLAALGTLALVLGSSLCVERMSGGLPRSFAFPLVALGLERLQAGRARALAVLTALGAALYPVAGVILGGGLVGMLLLPSGSRGEADAWSPRRRSAWIAGTVATCVVLLLPGALATRRFGPVIRPADVAEVPEAGPGGRYGPDDRAPFASYFATAAPIFRRAVAGASLPWVPSARSLLGPTLAREGRGTDRVGLLAVGALLVIALGWTRLALRDAGARRALLLLPVAVLAHAVACRAAPFFYLPQRYVLYVVPLCALLFLPTAIVGILPQAGRGARVSLQAAFTALLLVFLAGRVGPRAGLGVDLRPGAELLHAVAALPTTACIAGWPTGAVNNIPYAARRPVLLSAELHQAFHRGFVEEMRLRMQELTATYLGTDGAALDALRTLRERWGVTHLLVDRRHLTEHPPTYFAPFDDLVRRTVAAREGRPPELLRHLAGAAVFRRGDVYLLDVDRLLSRAAAPPGDEP